MLPRSAAAVTTCLSIYSKPELLCTGAWAASRARSQPRSLSDVRAIPANVAILIIANVSVEPANDGLFPHLLAQTWRMK